MAPYGIWAPRSRPQSHSIHAGCAKHVMSIYYILQGCGSGVQACNASNHGDARTCRQHARGRVHWCCALVAGSLCTHVRQWFYGCVFRCTWDGFEMSGRSVSGNDGFLVLNNIRSHDIGVPEVSERPSHLLLEPPLPRSIRQSTGEDLASCRRRYLCRATGSRSSSHGHRHRTRPFPQLVGLPSRSSHPRAANGLKKVCECVAGVVEQTACNMARLRPSVVYRSQAHDTLKAEHLQRRSFAKPVWVCSFVYGDVLRGRPPLLHACMRTVSSPAAARGGAAPAASCAQVRL